MKTIIAVLLLIYSGIAFTCPPGTYPVSEHPRTDYYRSDGTHYSAAEVSNSCRSFNNKGKINLKFEDEMPVRWPHKEEKFKKWNKKQKKWIKKRILSISKKLIDIGDVRVLRAKKSETEGNPSSSASEEKIIVLYDSAFQGNVDRILIHEFAHFAYNSLSDVEKESYWQSSGWEIDGSRKLSTSKKVFSAPDGIVDPDEDFANDVELFYSSPKKLKKIAPKSHQWIKIFLGAKK